MASPPLVHRRDESPCPLYQFRRQRSKRFEDDDNQRRLHDRTLKVVVRLLFYLYLYLFDLSLFPSQQSIALSLFFFRDGDGNGNNNHQAGAKRDGKEAEVNDEEDEEI
ncbi:hypothetical protein PIB30_001454 [Stylosanthes scabra]|uniref:Uncharacterized protein n=1 Tax=Stylosanthes scabra TaxID=79078 RepID=A0ABU6Q3M2_9FABA|nr:hypothetical protein [Stylosanthes scabra]